MGTGVETSHRVPQVYSAIVAMSFSTSISLLQRLRHDEHDDEAWAEFIDRYGRLMLDWARESGLTQEDARDLVQEVLLNLVGQIGRYRRTEQQTFRTWLKMVMWRVQNRLSQEGGFPEALGGGLAERLLAMQPAWKTLQERLQLEVDRDLLEVAIARTKSRVEPRTWQAFEMQALQGASGEDVARETGMSLSNIYVSRHRVQKILRDELLSLKQE
jgi:RNA polymerase sigma-70 factor (ECF subfamily)